MTPAQRRLVFDVSDGNPQAIKTLKELMIFKDPWSMIEYLRRRGVKGQAVVDYYIEAGGTGFQMGHRIEREFKGLMYRPFLLKDMAQ